ncbi:MAG: hypothetical protein ACTTI5_01565, partial [Treponema sp.]
MKRFVLGKLFIISAALIVLSFISCNQNLKEENGMGKVVISLGNTARSLDDEGLPVLNDKNTVIMITDDSQPHPHPKQYNGSRVSVEFPIGTEITVSANVETAASFRWRGEKSLTVAAGVNNVSLELSKTPSYVPSVGFSLNGEQLSIKIGSKAISPTLAVYSDFTPKIKRDGIGRVYVLYKDKNDSEKYLTRYTVEGEADRAFNKAVSKLSWNNQNFMNNIENIAVDTETGNIFLIEKEGILPAGFRIYCITKEAKDFKYYLGDLSGGVAVNSAAAYNGTLFLEASTETGATHTEKLLAYKTELETVGERNKLVLRSAGTTGIATISPEDNGKTDCNDIHADGTGVYVLLSSTSLKGNIYSVGQLIRYEYKNSTFTKITEVGLNSVSLKNGGIAYDVGCFSKPVAFIGWNEEMLYIADDGINIEDTNENFRVDGNKNRTANFEKAKNDLSFNLFSSDITWYEEYPKYTPPNTPVLSWEKGTHGMKYWTSADGIEDFSDKNKLWESDKPNIKPLDIFCYDQDGNLYIFYKDANYNKVKQFELNDGSYVSTNESFATLDNEPTAIAVDISNGKNCLYYAYKTSATNECFIIKKYKSGTPSVVTKIEDAGTTITALAANKDGLFAAIKNVDNANTYTLTVKKYNKENGGVSGSVNVVANEPSATSPSSGLHDEYNSAINALQINNGSLYGIMSKEKITKQSGRVCDFNNGSSLYGFGETKESLSESEPIKSYNNTDKVGYGFYRFIAVQEQKKKLVIASDGAAWIKDQSKIANCNKVFVYDLDKKI